MVVWGRESALAQSTASSHPPIHLPRDEARCSSPWRDSKCSSLPPAARGWRPCCGGCYRTSVTLQCTCTRKRPPSSSTNDSNPPPDKYTARHSHIHTKSPDGRTDPLGDRVELGDVVDKVRGGHGGGRQVVDGHAGGEEALFGFGRDACKGRGGLWFGLGGRTEKRERGRWWWDVVGRAGSVCVCGCGNGAISCVVCCLQRAELGERGKADLDLAGVEVDRDDAVHAHLLWLLFIWGGC